MHDETYLHGLTGEEDPLSSQTTPFRFIADEWGRCSVSCGEGVRQRQVHCKILLEFSRTVAKLPDNKCTGPKPTEIERCFMEPCSAEIIDVKDDPYRHETGLSMKTGGGGVSTGTYSWKEQGYTKCSATCLGGVQELIVNCVRDDNQKVTSLYLCPKELKPEVIVKTCNEEPCPPRWNYSDFQPCTHSCGLGIQTREVNCVNDVEHGGVNVVVPSSMCPQPPPPDRQYCNILDCPVKWQVLEWSKCSKQCGTGEKTRTVECKQVMAQNHTVVRPPASCPSPKPATKKPCNTKSCVLDSDKPHIDVSNNTFIQHSVKKKKVYLRVGGAATVFSGTLVKIKCPVKRFNRTRIQWAKDHNYLPKSKKFKISKKGALRIQNVTYRDNGVYTCVAGRSSANLTLTVKQKPGEFMNSDEIQRQTSYVRDDQIGRYSLAGVQPRMEGPNLILGNDDHSHESRPDIPKKQLKASTKLFIPTLPSLKKDSIAIVPRSTSSQHEQVRFLCCLIPRMQM